MVFIAKLNNKPLDASDIKSNDIIMKQINIHRFLVILFITVTIVINHKYSVFTW